MVMVGGGRTKSTLLFPKNDWSVEGEVNVVPLIVLLLLIVTIRFEEVFLKALVLIDVTESGMFMDVKIVQYLKASKSIELTALPIVTDVKRSQLAKAEARIDVTESGMFMDVKLVQLRKAEKPIDATELPIVIDVKPVQLMKTAEPPIDVTELGIVIDVKSVQL
jgi:hypothetical protein